jgi:predicted ribosomally synthesized peptide with SipW-like signal peptide
MAHTQDTRGNLLHTPSQKGRYKYANLIHIIKLKYMKKILFNFVALVAVASVASVATWSYFTANDTSEDNEFITGTMQIDIDQTMESLPVVVDNWAPGQSEVVRFNVDNTGSLPVHLKGYAAGTWGDPGLDDGMVKVTKVEYKNGSTWTDITSSASGLTGEYYYSPNGTDSSLYELAAGSSEEFRLTVEFDASADNSYMNKTYTAEIHMAAKQTDPSGATWPGSY